MNIFNFKQHVREIIWFIQRGKRGWSDKDIWNIDSYLNKIIPQMLVRLKETQTGLPTWTDNKTEEDAKKEWDEILDTIIYMFHVNQKIEDMEWQNIPKNKQTLSVLKFAEENNVHIMTKEERDLYNKGWFYLKKYYNYLWD